MKLSYSRIRLRTVENLLKIVYIKQSQQASVIDQNLEFIFIDLSEQKKSFKVEERELLALF